MESVDIQVTELALDDWRRINQGFWREAIDEFDNSEGHVSYPAFLMAFVGEKWRDYVVQN